jgi:hypothetical protein
LRAGRQLRKAGVAERWIDGLLECWRAGHG